MRIVETALGEALPTLLAVVAAEQAGPYTLTLTLATGEQQMVDFEPFLRNARHPAMRAYSDETRFRQFELVHGNLNWNNYDLIFSVADLFKSIIQ